MSLVSQYKVVPLATREHSAKQDSILEAKYKAAPSKRLTLNERFGVIEKGYVLEAVNVQPDTSNAPVHIVVHERHLISKKDFIEQYKAKNPTLPLSSDDLNKSVEEDKENVSAKIVNEKNRQEKGFTADGYVLEVTKSILGSI